MQMISDILDNKEKIVEKIVEKTGMDKSEVEKRVKDKVEEYGGLLTESGAAFAIARELGVDLGTTAAVDTWEDIGKITEELGFVSVVGVVKAISQTREWEKNGSSGKVVRILLADNTGQVWVVLWNQDVELVSSGQIKVGNIIGIKNGVVKKSIRGELEISVGIRSRVIIDPKTDKEFPEVGGTKKISELKTGDTGVTVFGRVVSVSPRHSFTSGDRTGEVASLTISDGKSVRVVLWGENAKVSDSISPGMVVKVENGTVKDNNGKIELHVGWNGRLVLEPDDAPELPEVKPEDELPSEAYKRTTIAEINGEGRFEIRALVAKIYPPTRIRVCPVCGAIVEDICPEHGEGKDTLIVNMELDDGTGVIRGVAFRDLAEKFLNISEIDDKEINRGMDERLGDELIIGGQVKKNETFDRLELHLRYFKNPNLDKEIEMVKRGE